MALPASPVVVLGMHRAGTSMVTRLLHLCGLYLGPETDLLPPTPENEAGYWEHAAIVHLNERVLARLDAAWDDPPPLDAAWNQLHADAGLQQAAQITLARLRRATKWGWKDPRTTLTLPFWQATIGLFPIIVCVRDPVTVARSLNRRLDGVNFDQGLALWTAYYRALLHHLQPGQAIFTHFDSYFTDPIQEMTRLFDFLAWSPPPARRQAALATIKPHLRHHRSHSPQLAAAGVPPATVTLYQSLLDRCGSVYARLPAPDSGQQDELVTQLQTELLAAERLIGELKTELKEKTDLAIEATVWRHWVREIQATRAWQLVNRWWAFKNRFVRPGSAQDEQYQIWMKDVEAMLQHGPRAMLQGRQQRATVLAQWQAGNLRAGRHPFADNAYARWARLFEPDSTILAQQRAAVSDEGPIFTFYTNGAASEPGLLRATAAAVSAQTYPRWRWYLFLAADGAPPALPEDERIYYRPVADPDTALHEQLTQMEGDYFAPIAIGDTVAPATLFDFFHAWQKQAADIFYSDADGLNEAGQRERPLFKPAWSPALMFSYNLLAPFAAVQRRRLTATAPPDPALGAAARWDWCWRLAAGSRQVCHVPGIHYHQRHRPPLPAGAPPAAIAAHLQRSELPGATVDPAGVPRWQMTERPRVSIIIPSKDKADVLGVCLHTLFTQTSYDNYQVVVVDTGSQAEATWALYRQYATEPRFQQVTFPETSFNFSAACNFGAAHAPADLFLFLNNDTEIKHEDWLDLMVQWFALPEVGIVGPQLRFPSGQIQHAGVFVGLGGLAAHPFTGMAPDAATLFGRPDWYRDLNAVTAACMLTSRAVFEQVGGFDETFILNFSDIAFCLSARAAGYRVVYTPHVQLTHHESLTHQGRVPRQDFERASDLFRPWLTQGDPYFHDRLDYNSTAPRFRKSMSETPLAVHLRAMSHLPQRTELTEKP